jgi:hypothetical protein
MGWYILDAFWVLFGVDALIAMWRKKQSLADRWVFGPLVDKVLGPWLVRRRRLTKRRARLIRAGIRIAYIDILYVSDRIFALSAERGDPAGAYLIGYATSYDALPSDRYKTHMSSLTRAAYWRIWSGDRTGALSRAAMMGLEIYEMNELAANAA